MNTRFRSRLEQSVESVAGGSIHIKRNKSRHLRNVCRVGQLKDPVREPSMQIRVVGPALPR